MTVCEQLDNLYNNDEEFSFLVYETSEKIINSFAETTFYDVIDFYKSTIDDNDKNNFIKTYTQNISNIELFNIEFENAFQKTMSLSDQELMKDDVFQFFDCHFDEWFLDISKISILFDNLSDKYTK